MNNFSQWRPHPWHGISAGKNPPELVNAYIEITPFDSVKYEIDKETGYLKVDRPQLMSSLPPALYGFIPRTYCGEMVGRLSPGASYGDRDPLDICVFSERAINHSEIIAPARVIGGLRMIDKGEADDKIIAVLESDPYYAAIHDIKDLEAVVVKRLEHYFATYKLVPGQGNVIQVQAVYGLEVAKKVIHASFADYKSEFGS